MLITKMLLIIMEVCMGLITTGLVIKFIFGELSILHVYLIFFIMLFLMIEAVMMELELQEHYERLEIFRREQLRRAMEQEEELDQNLEGEAQGDH